MTLFCDCMSECVIVVNANSAIFQLYHGENNDDDEVGYVLDKHDELDCYSASSLKQQSADRHVAQIGHIILIPREPVFVLSPKCCVLSGEPTNTNLIVLV